MLQAAWWGFVGGASLLIGAVVGIVANPRQRIIGWVMAFGAGVLISALAFELTQEAFRQGGLAATGTGLALGALAFFLGDRAVDRAGGDHRKRSGGEQEGGSGTAILLGAVMDGIPESAAIGVSLLAGGSVGVPVLAGVFLSNLPESMAAATGLRRAGHSRGYILGTWFAVVAVSTVAAAVGYAVLGSASPAAVAAIQAFAAGAVLTMLADTMMPEAFEHGGDVVGLLTVLGFALAFSLSALG